MRRVYRCCAVEMLGGDTQAAGKAGGARVGLPPAGKGSRAHAFARSLTRHNRPLPSSETPCQLPPTAATFISAHQSSRSPWHISNTSSSPTRLKKTTYQLPSSARLSAAATRPRDGNI